MSSPRWIRIALLAVACASAPLAHAASVPPPARATAPASAQLIAKMWMQEPNWAVPIVPRMSADGDSLAALSASDSLLSSLPTYVNWSTYKNPAVCGSWTDELVLDGEPVSLIRRSDCVWLARPFPALNDGPFTVPGGRHILTGYPDIYREVCTDYSFQPIPWSGQWVWSPMPAVKGTPVVSTQAPPPQQLHTGFAQPCGDGYQVTRANAYAWVVAAVATDAGQNHDLVVYSDPWTGGNTGFSQVMRGSSQAAGHVDFVVGDAGSALGAVFPAVLRGANAYTSGYVLDWSDADGRRSATADASWTGALEPNRLADVYEVWLDTGASVRMDLSRTSGSNVLGVAVFPPPADSAWARAEAIATGATYQSDTYDTLSVTATSTGWHPVVVFRDAPPGAGETSGYTLAVGPQATLGLRHEPARLYFAGATPNPIRGIARLVYGLATGGRMRLAVYDLGGRRVRTLVDGVRPAGSGAATWDLRDEGGARVGAGVYWARFEAAGATLTRPVVVTR